MTPERITNLYNKMVAKDNYHHIIVPKLYEAGYVAMADILTTGIEDGCVILQDRYDFLIKDARRILHIN